MHHPKHRKDTDEAQEQELRREYEEREEHTERGEDDDPTFPRIPPFSRS